MMRAACACAVSIALGCGDNEPPVVLNVIGSTELVLYRDAARTWRTPPSVPSELGRSYELVVTGDVEIAIVCVESSGRVLAQELFATAQEIEAVLHQPFAFPAFCDIPSDPNPTPVEVTGNMAQTGTVFVDVQNAHGTGRWPYSIPTFAGTKDVVGAASGAMVILHDAPTSGVTVDVTQGGYIETLHVDIGNAAGDDSVTGDAELWTRNFTLVRFLASPPLFPVPPTDQLEDGDVVDLYVTAEDRRQESTRLADLTITDHTPGSIELMPRLSNIVFDPERVHVSWSDLPAFTTVEATYYDAVHGSNIVTASKEWAYTHGDGHGIEFDYDVPGFQDRWRVDPTSASREIWVADQAAELWRASVFAPKAALGSARRRSLAEELRGRRAH